MKTCEKDKTTFPPASDILEKKDDLCPVDWALKIADLASAESCGKCLMCREGSLQIRTILTDLVSGRGESDDLELIADLCSVINETASCDQIRDAVSLIELSLNSCREEWESHLRRKRCAALQCAAYVTIAVSPETCQGCGACVEVCPENALAGGEGLIHIIDSGKCTRCLACIDACSFEAIAKYGAVLPKVPAEPVPVGTFTVETGRRRRRRG